MKVIILPGYSPHNLDWALSIKKYLGRNHEVVIHKWRHWTKGTSLSLKYELEKIKSVYTDGSAFIAKSVGTYVLAKFVKQEYLREAKIILCGIPSTSEKRLEIYKAAFREYDPLKILVIQNSGDPFAGYPEVKKFTAKINSKIEVLEKSANTHDYPYFSDFKKFLN